LRIWNLTYKTDLLAPNWVTWYFIG
jgi:hypothetical protein